MNPDKDEIEAKMKMNEQPKELRADITNNKIIRNSNKGNGDDNMYSTRED